MRREHVQVDQCLRCSTPISQEDKSCGACGKPTPYMSFEELNAYEVAQYRAWQDKVAATA